jgi:hypothetical protein
MNPISLRTKITIIIAITIIVIGSASIIPWTQPQRSPEAFCRVINEERATLTNDSNTEARASAYRKLEASSSRTSLRYLKGCGKPIYVRSSINTYQVR